MFLFRHLNTFYPFASVAANFSENRLTMHACAAFSIESDAIFFLNIAFVSCIHNSSTISPSSQTKFRFSEKELEIEWRTVRDWSLHKFFCLKFEFFLLFCFVLDKCIFIKSHALETDAWCTTLNCKNKMSKLQDEKNAVGKCKTKTHQKVATRKFSYKCYRKALKCLILICCVCISVDYYFMHQLFTKM